MVCLEMNRDHSVIFIFIFFHSVIFETAFKYSILVPFADSISFKGFLPTVVDIMVI